MRRYTVEVVTQSSRAAPNPQRFEARAESPQEAKQMALQRASVIQIDGVDVPNVAEILDVEPDCCPTCFGLGVVPEGKGLDPTMARAFKERFRR